MISIEQEALGLSPEGEAIVRYRLRNKHGAEVELSNLGAAVTALRLPDRKGEICDVLLAPKGLTERQSGADRLGRVVGRYAGPIGYGRFEIQGREYQLECNAGRHYADGGAAGLDSCLWESSVEGNRIVMEYLSPEEHFPGSVPMQILFDFDDENTFEITYRAASECDTHLNLTHHLYLNLEGHAAGSVLEHTLQIHPAKVLQLNAKGLPTGRLLDPKDGPFDFLAPHTLGERITADENRMEELGGYAHDWMMSDWQRHILKPMATLKAPRSGRTVEVLSSYPGLHLSTGNDLGGAPRGKGGKRYADHSGVMLSPRYLADTPNRPEFPTTLLEAGELYCEKVVYRFGCE